MESILPLLAVVLGSLLTYLIQWATDRRAIRRDEATARERARLEAANEWSALQVRTLVELQESLEEFAQAIAVASVSTPANRMQVLPPILSAMSRSVMLCSRIDDAQLRDDVKAWIQDLSDARQNQPVSGQQAVALRRHGLHDRIGQALRDHHA